MAIRLKIGGYQTTTVDPLGRAYVGFFPRMTEEEAWEAGRGVWKVNADRAGRQRFAVVVGEGRVRAVAEITGITTHTTPSGERTALQGQVLPAGHPIRDAYLDQPDPVTTGSQNPVGYCDLDGEDAYLQRPCACGCGQSSDRDFCVGHDIRAIQQRVRQHFGGSPLALITFIDAAHPSTAGGREAPGQDHNGTQPPTTATTA